MPLTSREFSKTSSRSTQEVKDLLQSLFISEIFEPSSTLWICSPWLFDIPVIDNSGKAFADLDSSWPQGPITLTRCLKTLFEKHDVPNVVFITTDKTYNDQFKHALQHTIEDTLSHRYQIHIEPSERKLQHQKSIIGDKFFLWGGMNWTPTGLEISDEILQFETDPKIVSQFRIDFGHRYPVNKT